MKFSLESLETLNISMSLTDIINIQILKNKNIIIVDYYKNGKNIITKIPVYFYPTSILFLEFTENSIKIIVDWIEEYTIDTPVMTTDTLNIDKQFNEVYLNKSNNKTQIVIDQNIENIDDNILNDDYNFLKKS